MRLLTSWQMMAVIAVMAFAAAGWMAVEAAAGEPGVPTAADEAFGEAAEPQRAPLSVVGPIAPRWGPRQPGTVFTIDRYATGEAADDPAGGGVDDAAGSGRSDAGPASSADGGQRGADVHAGEADGHGRVAADEPDPVSVTIPALDVDAATIPLGLDAAGEIEVPADAGDAGWWRGGPEPGEPGASVLLGHVDSWEGPAVFYGLHTLELGDEIQVARTDGSTAIFAVTGGALYDKGHFPTDRVYSPDTDEPVLRLVTCGGRFDGETRSYESNYVIYAELVDRTRPPVPADL